MEQKLNSLKTYKDKGLLVVIGIIIAYVLMLLPLCRGNQFKAESETETAGSAELRQPGKLIEDDLGLHQEMPPIQKDTEHERFKELAYAYNLDPSMIWTAENFYGIKEGVILCITVAETSGGKFGAGYGNIGNVGNNDRGNRVSYAFLETSLEKIGMTLTNQNLGKKKTLGCLSNGGNCVEAYDNGMRYATSNGSWERNMVACLSTIYGPINAQTFSIRR